ncbi:MAG: hypothetical protein AD742_05630 [Methylibium sp. NZG]|nr:MAG: hypothetical protein AD742_05630 [Methylibium sp. NZG]
MRPALAVIAIPTAALCLMAACGGADTEPLVRSEFGTIAAPPSAERDRRDAALAWASDPASRVVVLDIDPPGSAQSAVERAAQERGAPGEGERVVYLVRAARYVDAESAVAQLEAHGFEWVAPVWQPPWQSLRTPEPRLGR